MSTDKPHLIRLDNQEIRPLDRKLVVGRHPACDFVISINDKNIGISGRHATVEAQGDIAWLEDLGSTNGTWVLGERIAKRTQLVSGDRFQLDRLEFEFRAPVKPAAPPPVRTSTTIAIGIEDLALPSPAPMPPAKSQPVRLTPPPPPPPAPAPPPPVPVKPEPVAAPPPPPKPVPPPAPEPVAPPVVQPPPVVEAKPVPPVVVPPTVEVKMVEAKEPTPPAPPPPSPPPTAPPPPPKEEPVVPPPAPPKPEVVAVPPPVPAPVPVKPEPEAPPPPAPKPAAREPAAPAADIKSATRPQKVAGAWISAEHSGKTKVLLPGDRDRLKEQMGSELYAGAEAITVPTLLFAPEGRRVTLAQRDSKTQEWTIGSNPEADVSLPVDGLSGLHAKILRNGQTWTISDLMSANGTFVNGEKINRSHLESGNQLGFGPVLCTFLLPEGSAAPRPAPIPAANKKSALPWPLLLGGGAVALVLIGVVIYLLLR